MAYDKDNKWIFMLVGWSGFMVYEPFSLDYLIPNTLYIYIYIYIYIYMIFE